MDCRGGGTSVSTNGCAGEHLVEFSGGRWGEGLGKLACNMALQRSFVKVDTDPRISTRAAGLEGKHRDLS